MKFDQENLKKLRGIIVFTIVVWVALWNYPKVFQGIAFALDIISPFLLGGAFAFVLNVPMRSLERRLFHNRYLEGNKKIQRMARPVSLILTIVILIGVIALVMFVVIPELGQTILSLIKTLQEVIPQAVTFLEGQFQENAEFRAWINSMNLSIDKILENISTFIQNGTGNLLNYAVSAVGSIVSGIATFIIAFAFACYILIQKEKLSVQMKKIIYAFLPEEKAEWCLEIAALTARSFSNFLTGQCLEALILGALFFVAMNLFGMPYALLVSLLVSVTALIPIFGAFLACIVGALLILTENPLQAVAFVLMFLILQQIEGNLIYPKVVGTSVGLPSIWVLACVTIGGRLMGVAGMVSFIPLASVVYSLVRTSVNRRLQRKHRDPRTARKLGEQETPAPEMRSN